MSAGICDNSGPATQVGWEPTTSRLISAPELPAPTNSTPPGCNWSGLRYEDECNCTMCGSSSFANDGVFGRPYDPVATTTLLVARSPALVSTRKSSPDLLSRFTRTQ